MRGDEIGARGDRHLRRREADPRHERGAVRAPAALAVAVRDEARRKARDEADAAAMAAAARFVRRRWEGSPAVIGTNRSAPVKSRKCRPVARPIIVIPTFSRDLVAHLRQARARHEERDAHLRRLDHHLGGEPARRVEDLVAAVDPVEPHLPGDRVDRVVAADVLDEHQDLGARRVVARERAAVHGARLLVDRLVQAHAVEQREERRLRQRRVRRQPHLVDLLHQVAEHGALAAAGGLRALRGLRLEVGEAVPGRRRRRRSRPSRPAPTRCRRCGR